MANNRRRAKGRADNGSFVAMPHRVLECEPYTRLSGKGVKLLVDLFAQFRGSNNGDLGMAWKVMKARGWRSRDTLDRASKELLKNGFIVRTRQGGRHQCNLYAVTWLSIDECDGKLDYPSTNVPPGYWKDGRPPN